MADLSNPLVWVDLEMTGLNPNVDHILEIAVIVTDSDLNVIAQGPHLVVYQPDDILARMTDYVRQMHTQSNLIEKVRQSQVSVADAENQVLEFLKKYLKPGQSPLCGNSVWQDRRFLAQYMPKFDDFLHYRIIDVSTVKELARRWAPEMLETMQKKNQHRALDDILESVAELQHYRSHWLKPKESHKKKDEETARFLSWCHAPRPIDGHKGMFGHLVVVGGDEGMWGAVALCAKAALLAGVGKVSVVTHPSHAALVTTICPEVISIPIQKPKELKAILSNATAVAVGPGMGKSDWSAQMSEAVFAMAEMFPLVIDAGALSFWGKTRTTANSIITPHPGEAALLLDSTALAVQADRNAAVKQLFEKSGSISVLKGHGTLVYDGNNTYTCPHGGPYMASAGMGDALTGIIASICARGVEVNVAARFGVIWHALAGDMAAGTAGRAKRVILASALIDQIQNI